LKVKHLKLFEEETLKPMKKKWHVPAGYQRLLHLSDIKHWNKLPRTIAETEVKYRGFYSCVYEDKKTVIVK
jgi:hypothetical protein